MHAQHTLLALDFAESCFDSFARVHASSRSSTRSNAAAAAATAPPEQTQQPLGDNEMKLRLSNGQVRRLRAFWRRGKRFKRRLACYQPAPASSPQTRGRNALLIDWFKRKRDLYSFEVAGQTVGKGKMSTKDVKMKTTYAQIASLKGMPEEIRTVADAQRLLQGRKYFTGNGYKRVLEILRTGYLQEVVAAENSKSFKSFSELMSLWGVGDKTAHRLLDLLKSTYCEAWKRLDRAEWAEEDRGRGQPLEQVLGIRRLQQLTWVPGIAAVRRCLKENPQRNLLTAVQPDMDRGRSAALRAGATHASSTAGAFARGSLPSREHRARGKEAAFRLSLTHCEDLSAKIPRGEVEVVQQDVRDASGSCYPFARVVCCGSYRRGKASSGDVDVLLSPDPRLVSDARSVLQAINEACKLSGRSDAARGGAAAEAAAGDRDSSSGSSSSNSPPAGMQEPPYQEMAPLDARRLALDPYVGRMPGGRGAALGARGAGPTMLMHNCYSASRAKAQAAPGAASSSSLSLWPGIDLSESSRNVRASQGRIASLEELHADSELERLYMRVLPIEPVIAELRKTYLLHELTAPKIDHADAEIDRIHRFSPARRQDSAGSTGEQGRHPGYRTGMLGSETFFFIGARKKLPWMYQRVLLCSLLEGMGGDAESGMEGSAASGMEGSATSGMEGSGASGMEGSGAGALAISRDRLDAVLGGAAPLTLSSAAPQVTSKASGTSSSSTGGPGGNAARGHTVQCTAAMTLRCVSRAAMDSVPSTELRRALDDIADRLIAVAHQGIKYRGIPSFFGYLRDRIVQQEVTKAAQGGRRAPSTAAPNAAMGQEGHTASDGHRRAAALRGLGRAKHILDTISAFAPTYRRIDIKSYPIVSWPYAQLYFTGSAHFNRSMRWYAVKVWGLSLSDKGLTISGQRNARSDKLFESCTAYARDEKEVFDHLGLDYVPPNRRNPENVVDFERMGVPDGGRVEAGGGRELEAPGGSTAGLEGLALGSEAAGDVAGSAAGGVAASRGRASGGSRGGRHAGGGWNRGYGKRRRVDRMPEPLIDSDSSEGV